MSRALQAQLDREKHQYLGTQPITSGIKTCFTPISSPFSHSATVSLDLCQTIGKKQTVLPSPEYPLGSGDATILDSFGQPLAGELPGGVSGLAKERQNCEGAQQNSTCALAASVVRWR